MVGANSPLAKQGRAGKGQSKRRRKRKHKSAASAKCLYVEAFTHIPYEA